MDHPQDKSEPLPLLARLYREKRSGLVTLGSPDGPLLLVVRDGQISALGPHEPPPALPEVPRPDDSASVRLRQILAEVGLETGSPRPKPARRAPALRERIAAALASDGVAAVFEEGRDAPTSVAETAGSTEPLILEAVRRLRDADAVRARLGDLDQRLVSTAALAEERTLTLLEGYLLSRIDGTASARQVLSLVPRDTEEAERSLLGLLLTGRVELRPFPAPRALRPEGAAGGAPAPDARAPSEPKAPPAPAAAAVGPVPSGRDVPLDPAAVARRREVLESFQSLPFKRDHFDMLGVEPGSTDADVRRAYSALVKRFHPDLGREPGLEDLHDVLAAIFVRVQEAWEVLGEAKSRATYEAHAGVLRRPREGAASLLGSTPATSTPQATAAPAAPAPEAPGLPGVTGRATSPPPPPGDYVASEETLLHAQILLLQSKYWEAITVLETALPRMEPLRHQNRGRILLARAYAKNPNWLRKAEEQLQDVLRTDPLHVDALFQLGLLYKAQGLHARAQGLFRRVVELKPDHKDVAAELTAEGGGGLLKRIFRRGKAS
ncbi:MAG TPA: DnaJ domain-containing protein [Vicinamibacteria bacterium]